MLLKTGCLNLDVIYADSAKIESYANHHTFAWCNSAEKHKAKIEEKTDKILELAEEDITDDKASTLSTRKS